MYEVFIFYLNCKNSSIVSFPIILLFCSVNLLEFLTPDAYYAMYMLYAICNVYDNNKVNLKLLNILFIIFISVQSSFFPTYH